MTVVYDSSIIYFVSLRYRFVFFLPLRLPFSPLSLFFLSFHSFRSETRVDSPLFYSFPSIRPYPSLSSLSKSSFYEMFFRILHLQFFFFSSFPSALPCVLRFSFFPFLLFFVFCFLSAFLFWCSRVD
jgi:hypothetical protein